MSVTLAFTTRIPLAVMIVMGIKQCENRNMLPSPASGQCGISCSKSSDEREYANFLAWAERCFPADVFNALPTWERVEYWRGKLIATCDYVANYTPGDAVWNEGYKVWWHLSNIKLLKEPISCRGSIGMWRLTDEVVEKINKAKENINFIKF